MLPGWGTLVGPATVGPTITSIRIDSGLAGTATVAAPGLPSSTSCSASPGPLASAFALSRRSHSPGKVNSRAWEIASCPVFVVQRMDKSGCKCGAQLV